MSKKKIIETSEFPYHIWARSNNRDYFPLPLVKLWTIFSEIGEKVSKKYSARINGFVLMDNHYHMILNTPQANLGAIMNYFQRDVSKATNRQTKRIDHVFGGTYKWNLIDSEAYLRHIYKYVFQNPCRAGLSNRVEGYRYSTIHEWLETRTQFPISIDRFTPEDYSSDQYINWLNDDFVPRQIEMIKALLRFRQSKLSRRRYKEEEIKLFLDNAVSRKR